MNKSVEQDAQYVAERDADATKEKIAETYAIALLGASDELNVSQYSVWDEYDSFIEQVLNAHPKFEEILRSEFVSLDEKLRIIDELCCNSSEIFRNFLKVVASRGRMGILREIRRACSRLMDVRKGRVLVKITTAVPLDSKSLDCLSSDLYDLIKGEPYFEVEVDPDMIGGIIVRVGDVIYDASIVTQLKKVRQNMIDRSAHEIQSRRDCFRNPEGN